MSDAPGYRNFSQFQKPKKASDYTAPGASETPADKPSAPPAPAAAAQVSAETKAPEDVKASVPVEAVSEAANAASRPPRKGRGRPPKITTSNIREDRDRRRQFDSIAASHGFTARGQYTRHIKKMEKAPSEHMAVRGPADVIKRFKDYTIAENIPYWVAIERLMDYAELP